MARNTSLFKIEGTLDGVTFYKTQDGYLVKKKSGVSGKRIAKDAVFARTRENGAEFGTAAKSGKMLRDALSVLLKELSDSKLTSKVTKLMTDLKNCDTSSPRGLRSVAEGLKNTDGKALLRGFNFNDASPLQAVLRKTLVVDSASGEITICNLNVGNDMLCPSSATHVCFKGAWLNINFETGSSGLVFGEEKTLSIANNDVALMLQPKEAWEGAGSNLVLLSISFFQQVNGEMYAIGTGKNNVLAVVEVF